MKNTDDINRMIKNSKQSVLIYILMGIFFLFTQSLTLILTSIDFRWSLTLIAIPAIVIILTVKLVKRENRFTKKLISIKKLMENENI